MPTTLDVKALSDGELYALSAQIQQEISARQYHEGQLRNTSPEKSANNEKVEYVEFQISGTPDYDQKNLVVKFSVRKSVPFRWVIQQYHLKTKTRPGSLKFKLGDKYIYGETTLTESGLNNGDTIHVEMVK